MSRERPVPRAISPPFPLGCSGMRAKQPGGDAVLSVKLAAGRGKSAPVPSSHHWHKLLAPPAHHCACEAHHNVPTSFSLLIRASFFFRDQGLVLQFAHTGDWHETELVRSPCRSVSYNVLKPTRPAHRTHAQQRNRDRGSKINISEQQDRQANASKKKRDHSKSFKSCAATE